LIVANLVLGAPFVISVEGEVYSDPTGKATDLELAGGAKQVLGAGRWVVREGRTFVISNESPTYHPSLAEMRVALDFLAGIGMDLVGDGGGVLVIVYAEIDRHGRGKRGKRYRARKTAVGVELLPDI
jgi:hypothetical protein